MPDTNCTIPPLEIMVPFYFDYYIAFDSLNFNCPQYLNCGHLIVISAHISTSLKKLYLWNRCKKESSSKATFWVLIPPSLVATASCLCPENLSGVANSWNKIQYRMCPEYKLQPINFKLKCLKLQTTYCKFGICGSQWSPSNTKRCNHSTSPALPSLP